MYHRFATSVFLVQRSNENGQQSIQTFIYYLSHRSVYPLYLTQKGGRMTNIEND